MVVVECYNEYSLGSTSDTKVGNRGWECCKFNDMLRSKRFDALDENVFKRAGSPVLSQAVELG